MYLFNLIIIILDGLIVYFTKSYFNDITYFYPMLSITLIVVLYENNQDYLKKTFIIGLIYDLLYSNILLYNALIFLLLSKINRKIFHLIRPETINKIFVLILNIAIYDTINFLIIYLSHYNNIYFNDLLYKISHSLILNIMSLFVLQFILKKINIKHKI